MKKTTVSASAPTAAAPVIVDRSPLQGRVTFSAEPTMAQYRFLVFCLASHEATATEFAPLDVPLDYLFEKLPADDTALREASLTLGRNCPCLSVREVNKRGGLVRGGSYAFITLFSFLSHTEGSRSIQSQLNRRLLDYIPQLRTLLPPALLAELPLAGHNLQLAA